MLRDPRRHHREVVGLLRVLGEELDRAGVAHEHRVGVVGVDVDRAGERAVADRHHDRRAHRGGDVDDLGHQRHPLRRRRRHRARAGERGADRGAHRRVLRLDVDDLAGRAPVGDELREALDDRRLRRDRVDRHDVRVDLPHRVRDRLAAGQYLELCELRHRCPPRPSRSRRSDRPPRRARNPCSSGGRSLRTSTRRARSRSRGSRASRGGSSRTSRGRRRAERRCASRRSRAALPRRGRRFRRVAHRCASVWHGPRRLPTGSTRGRPSARAA